VAAESGCWSGTALVESDMAQSAMLLLPIPVTGKSRPRLRRYREVTAVGDA
jgi:hypothetical protein